MRCRHVAQPSAHTFLLAICENSKSSAFWLSQARTMECPQDLRCLCKHCPLVAEVTQHTLLGSSESAWTGLSPGQRNLGRDIDSLTSLGLRAAEIMKFALQLSC